MSEPFTHSDLLRAAHFAAVTHATQCRKGAAAEPYINHLIEVAGILSDTAVYQDIPLLMAAFLHDTIEDTETKVSDLEGRFGKDVAVLVTEVTDDKRLKKQERKRLQVENAPKKSARARLLKTADKISNLRSIAQSPPAGWPTERMTDYVDWAIAVVDGCLDGPNGFKEALQQQAAGDLRATFDDAVRLARTSIAARQTA